MKNTQEEVSSWIQSHEDGAKVTIEAWKEGLGKLEPRNPKPQAKEKTLCATKRGNLEFRRSLH